MADLLADGGDAARSQEEPPPVLAGGGGSDASGASLQPDATPQSFDERAHLLHDRIDRSISLSKTKLCKFFNKGACQKGETCTFAHGRQQLQRKPDLYRTKLCAQFVNTGSCAFDAACKYAHFLTQVRPEEVADEAASAPETAPPPAPPPAMPQPELPPPPPLPPVLPEAPLEELWRQAAPPGVDEQRQQCEMERDVMAWQLLEARHESARLRAQVQLLQAQMGAGAMASPDCWGAPDLAPVREAEPGVEAENEEDHHDPRGVGRDDARRPGHSFDHARDREEESGEDCELTWKVKNTFIDVPDFGDSEHHRRTSSVPPRNQWLPLWMQLDVVGGSLSPR